MGMIIPILIIYLTHLESSYSYRSNSNLFDVEECQFGSGPGRCLELRKCPSLMRTLIHTTGRQKLKMFDVLRSAHCGFNGKEPIVCCPDSRSRGIVFDSSDEENIPKQHVLSPRFCGRMNVNHRIFGGDVAGLYDYPWMALIGYNTVHGLQFRCGGTLINRRYVLTAGHCVANVKNLIPHIVRLGEHDLSDEVDCAGVNDCAPPARDFQIRRFILHPEFNLKDLRNDIALIELAEDVNYSNSIQPVCLPEGEAQMRRRLDGERATIGGWGATRNGTYSSVLRTAEIRVISNEQCRKTYKGILSISEFQICAGGDSRVDSCNGDSGGPLKVVGENRYKEPVYIQYGVVSFGPKICGTSKPGVYTRIPPYMNWIMSNIN